MSSPIENKVYIYDPVWMPIYTACCIVGSLPFLLITALIFGVSVASDIVFGILVILGGVLGDFAFRKLLKKVMYILPAFDFPVLYTWPPIGIFIIIFRPFE